MQSIVVYLVVLFLALTATVPPAHSLDVWDTLNGGAVVDPELQHASLSLDQIKATLISITKSVEKKNVLSGFVLGACFGRTIERYVNKAARVALFIPLVVNLPELRSFVREKLMKSDPGKNLNRNLEKFCDERKGVHCASAVHTLRKARVSLMGMWRNKIRPFLKKQNSLVAGFLIGLGFRVSAFLSFR
mmetsp:Transcript_30135/g.59866  ORF Transcript_30135/g.59866 Transcript_30135/m.59866 type:complete len:189 (-) Transcript_30135:38-604(-)